MTGLDQRRQAAALPRGPLAGFAAGSLGMGVWVTVPGLLLLYFLTDVLAVAPWLAGLTLLLPKIADVLLHPWIGHRCDVEQARRGHRRRLLLVGCALPLAFAALFQIFDGIQGVAAGALRGAGDVRFPFLANLGGHWLVGFPLALVLGFGLHLGAVGLWWGLLTGLGMVAALLTWRFHRISRGFIART